MTTLDLQTYNKKIFGYSLFAIIGFISRVALGIVFLAAAIGKIPHINEFLQTVSQYHMLPTFIIPAFAMALPWFELILGIYIVLGIYIPITMKVTIGFLIVFMIAITYALLTNQPVTGCGCFYQSLTEKLTWIEDVRDIGFLLLALIVLYTKSSLFSVDFYLHKQKG